MRQSIPRRRTTRDADSKSMMQMNDVAHTLHALRAEIALVGHTAAIDQRAEVSGPCGNHKFTCKLDHASTHMPETHTTRGAGKRGMMLTNDVAHTLRALCGEIALAGRTSAMGKRAEVSGLCGNHKFTWKLGSRVNTCPRRTQRAAPAREA